MKFAPALRALMLLPLFAFGLAGCEKPDEPAPVVKSEPSATPTPSSASKQEDLVDAASDKLKHKADKTIKALTGFLHKEDPRFQAKLEKLTDKIAHDKDNWRKKLQEKRQELQPQIEQLKEQVAKAEGKSKDDVNRQLDTLEAESHSAEKKLSELEGASGDAWKKFKAQLKEDEAKGDASKGDADMPPTPTPTP